MMQNLSEKVIFCDQIFCDEKHFLSPETFNDAVLVTMW